MFFLWETSKVEYNQHEYTLALKAERWKQLQQKGIKGRLLGLH